MPWRRQVWEQRRVPRGGGSVGRAGTATPCPSPAPGHVCLSVPRGVCVGFYTGGSGWDADTSKTPRQGQCGTAAPLLSHLTPIFGAYLQTPCGSPQPPRPARCFPRPAEAGLTRLPWER